MRDLADRSSHMDPTLKPLLVKGARYAILAITLVAVLGQFGVQTTSLIALLGATALAIGLALQGTLSNVASGVMLLFLRPFRVTEKVKLADAIGTVREIGLFRTTILTDDGVYVSIPNATLFAGTIQNLSREGRRRVSFSMEIDRAENLDRVQQTIQEAMAREPRVLKMPACSVEVDTLGPLSTTLLVHVWVENRDFIAVQSDLKKLARHALQGAEVSAPVPVAAPAVAPWTPPAGKAGDEQSDKKPN
jgi:small conductance mechanosensitive channel